VRLCLSETGPLTGPLSFTQMIHEWIWSSGGMILTQENWRTRRETCPSANLSTINPTSADMGAHLGLRSKKPATNRLSYGKADTYPYQHPRELLCFSLRLACLSFRLFHSALKYKDSCTSEPVSQANWSTKSASHNERIFERLYAQTEMSVVAFSHFLLSFHKIMKRANTYF
jgi:hypothetical protein